MILTVKQLQFVGDDMNTISGKIKYLPATNDPLSADVYCIEGDKYCYVYDVGNDKRSLQYINQIGKEKVVVLSHHHKDHTGNIVGLHYRDLYVGKKTYEIIGKGIIVEDALTINDGVRNRFMALLHKHRITSSEILLRARIYTIPQTR